MIATPKPGSIITLAVDVYDESGNELSAELDVVFLEEVRPGRLQVSASDADDVTVYAYLDPGEWYQRPEEVRP